MIWARTFLSSAALVLFVFLFTPSGPSRAAEGGYSNYVPGFYGDLALAVEPEQGLAIRNDFYFYNAEADRSVRSGLVELEVDLEIRLDYLSILYKTDQKVKEMIPDDPHPFNTRVLCLALTRTTRSHWRLQPLCLPS